MAKKILLVDDNPDIIKVVSAQLIAKGYQVISDIDAEKAYVLAETESPDLLILDIMMPGTDGVELSQKFQSNPKTKNIPTMFLTGLEKPQEETLIGGSNRICAKPINFPLMLSKIERLLELYKE